MKSLVAGSNVTFQRQSRYVQDVQPEAFSIDLQQHGTLYFVHSQVWSLIQVWIIQQPPTPSNFSHSTLHVTAKPALGKMSSWVNLYFGAPPWCPFPSVSPPQVGRGKWRGGVERSFPGRWPNFQLILIPSHHTAATWQLSAWPTAACVPTWSCRWAQEWSQNPQSVCVCLCMWCPPNTLLAPPWPQCPGQLPTSTTPKASSVWQSLSWLKSVILTSLEMHQFTAEALACSFSKYNIHFGTNLRFLSELSWTWVEFLVRQNAAYGP